MTVSVRLPQSTERQLIAYCQAHRISKTEVVKKALDLFLEAEIRAPTPYELGERGFDADQTHEGDIARQSKELLRKKYRGPVDRWYRLPSRSLYPGGYAA